ncbi:alpha/beta-type small acid-soluble spore protein [Alicyclobacillus kakegawensis]|uniref:alpha/beta-type small acid-soluble spore protein n=1 Tax=Alicyclobacillus kakegawensis TaxID=392012 RepID=UPI00082DCF59|nr:alpha/beta-type small acid-soluble spore protein [Alicyclobacillus kakegawensis]
MARRRNRLLVPEARQAIDQLKQQVSDEIQRSAPPTPPAPPLTAAGPGAPAAAPARGQRARASVDKTRSIDGGQLTTREAGELGGEIGGNMVKRLIEIAEQELAQKEERPLL